jgi:hypothetical protein
MIQLAMRELDDTEWQELYVDYSLSRQVVDKEIVSRNSELYNWHLARVYYLEEYLGLVSPDLCYNQICQDTTPRKK